MGKRHNPRHGSMGVWPRKRAARQYARIRGSLDGNLPIFAGYKVGMTQIIATDSGKNSPTKGEDVAIPVTIIECPPLKIIGARSYKPVIYGIGAEKTVYLNNDAARKTGKHSIGKTEDLGEKNLKVIVSTQPPFKKTPEVFEIPFKGSKEELITFLKEKKEIKVSEVYKEGDYFDSRAITKGKGFQGPVKRFGVNLRSHKSEKTKRGPGSLGGWISQQHTMYRIAHAGQMGYHQRTQYNNQILKITEDAKEIEEINPKGGFVNYSVVKNPYILVRGSVQGPKKRLITMTKPVRQKRKDSIPTIQKIITTNAQG